MKRILVILFAASSLTVARADFVLKQQIKSVGQNGVVTLEVKDDQSRLDMPTDLLGDVSVIQDLNTGDKTMMIHQRKIAKLESGAEVRQSAEQFGYSTNGVVPKPVDTGKTGKVGDYDTEIYTWTNNNGVGGTLWVAKNYPDFDKIKIYLKKLEESPAGQMMRGDSPDGNTLPGMVVKSEKVAHGDIITETLISAKEQPVNASDFDVPDDYRIIGLPITTNPTTTPDK
ncbi:MAG TPA: DUF4412 domain-containing protein [Verrucomicrobiae bacterium]|nr:DUF4412 domain-containing protein [Verrucomicrobiae bacterium]